MAKADDGKTVRITGELKSKADVIARYNELRAQKGLAPVKDIHTRMAGMALIAKLERELGVAPQPAKKRGTGKGNRKTKASGKKGNTKSRGAPRGPRAGTKAAKYRERYAELTKKGVPLSEIVETLMKELDIKRNTAYAYHWRIQTGNTSG